MPMQQKTTGLTYEDLASFPDDNLRRELIDGELIVTAAPRVRHQRVVARLTGELWNWTRANGGEVLPGPTDVFFSDVDVVEPDILFVRPENLAVLEEAFVRGAPDLVIEVSSPSTRRLELIRKRDLYERCGVPEYWYVDLEADRVDVYRRADQGFDRPLVLERPDELTSPLLPRLAVTVDDILGAPEE